MVRNSARTSIVFPILLALYEICTYLSNDAYLPSLPHITFDLHTNNHLVQLTLTTWFMGSACMQLFLGPLADKVGRRRVLLSGGLIFILVTFGCAVSNNIFELLIFRFIQGATVTSMIIAGYATIHELFDREKAIHTLSMMNTITLLAPSLGPLFGATILHFSIWRTIFYFLAVLATIVIIGLYFKMPETNTHQNERINIKKIIRQYKNIISNKSFILFLLIPRCLFVIIIAWIAAGPFLLIDRFHFKAMGFGIAQVFIFGSLIISTRSIKWLMTKYSLNTITIIGIIFSTIGGLYSILTAYLFPNAWLNMIIAMMFEAIAFGLLSPICERLGIESSIEPMGSKMALSSLFFSIAGTLGSILISGFYNDTLLSLSIILFIISVIAVIIRMLMHYLHFRVEIL